MFEWFAILTPLVFGFGSVAAINVVHGKLHDEEHGINATIPALLSVHLVYATYALVIGSTYGWIILRFPYPELQMGVKYFSVILLMVLAYLIWARSKAITEENYLSLREEFLLQVTRPTVPSLIMLVMFSIFLDVTRPLMLQVIAMAVGVIVLSFITQVFWIVAGMVLDRDDIAGKTLLTMDRILAVIYVLLGLWVIIL